MGAFLLAAWRSQHGRDLAEVRSDLDAIALVFRPDARGATLRKAVQSLGPIHVPRPPELPESMYLGVDDERGFVTAEGRLLAEILEKKPVGGVAISDDDLLEAATLLADFYGSSVRQAVAKTLSSPDLRPLSFAFALLLLVNGSLGEKKALRLPSSREDDRRLMQALAPVLNAFAEAIGARSLAQKEAQRMEGNWVITEVPRQLPALAQREGSSIWLRDGATLSTAHRLGELLARRRRPPTRSDLHAGLQDLVDAYRRIARPALSSLGLAHDSPHLTEQLPDAVLAGFDRSRGLG